MTSSNFILTLSLLAVSSCLALAKPLSADSQQLLSQLLSSGLIPRVPSSSYSLPSSSQGKLPSQEQNDVFLDDSNMADDTQQMPTAFNSARDDSGFLGDLPLGAINRLDILSRKRLLQDLAPFYYGGILSGAATNNGSPVEGAKRKRQPHLGFHASRG